MCVNGPRTAFLQLLIDAGLKALARDGLAPDTAQVQFVDEIFDEASEWRCRSTTPTTIEPTTVGTLAPSTDDNDALFRSDHTGRVGARAATWEASTY